MTIQTFNPDENDLHCSHRQVLADKNHILIAENGKPGKIIVLDAKILSVLKVLEVLSEPSLYESHIIMVMDNNFLVACNALDVIAQQ